jgi:antibiotic biosynthesis monooxygenase (ABM) superfamily enzyme
MYPHVKQFQTRQQEIARRLEAVEASARHPGAARAPGHRGAGRPPAGPPRYKLALLTWVSAYAVITLLLSAVGPAIAAWPLALRALLISVAMVVTLTWVVMPRLTRLFGGWLQPSA